MPRDIVSDRLAAALRGNDQRRAASSRSMKEVVGERVSISNVRIQIRRDTNDLLSRDYLRTFIRSNYSCPRFAANCKTGLRVPIVRAREMQITQIEPTLLT